MAVDDCFQVGGRLLLEDINPKKLPLVAKRQPLWKAFRDCGIFTQQKMGQAIKETMQAKYVPLKECRVNENGATFRVIEGVSLKHEPQQPEKCTEAAQPQLAETCEYLPECVSTDTSSDSEEVWTFVDLELNLI